MPTYRLDSKAPIDVTTINAVKLLKGVQGNKIRNASLTRKRMLVHPWFYYCLAA
jgi:hypothetical protein